MWLASRPRGKPCLTAPLLGSKCRVVVLLSQHRVCTWHAPKKPAPDYAPWIPSSVLSHSFSISLEWSGRAAPFRRRRTSTHSFCGPVLELVVLEVKASGTPGPESGTPWCFLMNARGNDHSIGIRILSLW